MMDLDSQGLTLSRNKQTSFAVATEAFVLCRLCAHLLILMFKCGVHQPANKEVAWVAFVLFQFRFQLNFRGFFGRAGL